MRLRFQASKYLYRVLSSEKLGKGGGNNVLYFGSSKPLSDNELSKMIDNAAREHYGKKAKLVKVLARYK